MIYAFIMAGGAGTRYWPKSRRNMPKHLVPFGEIGVLLQRTLERMTPFFQRENTFVVTAKGQEDLCREFSCKLPSVNVICEPIGMDSAPCVALSAAIAFKLDPDAITAMFPADHLIYPQDAFLRTIHRAVRAASDGAKLVTIGIPPTRPATEYGYIHRGWAVENGEFTVTKFREKPAESLARDFIATGEYYWNCGIFVWKAKKILDELRRFLPNTYERVMEIASHFGKDTFAEVFAREYPHTDKISIDYAVMEKTADAMVIEAEFQWDDIGNWLAIERHLPRDVNGNAICGTVVETGAQGCILIGEGGRLVTVMGAKDMVVVDTPDALLVMPKSEAANMKQLIEKLKRDGYERYL